MMSSNSKNLVNITKNPCYSRKSGFLCVISNSQFDFVCHEIFVKSASKYFRDLLAYEKEDYEIEPGQNVPRLVTVFYTTLILTTLKLTFFI